MVSIKKAFQSGNRYAVGVKWDSTDPSPILRRWFMAGGYEQDINFDANPFNHLYPWKGMIRETRADDGSLIAQFGDPSYTEDGTNGQVVVPILSHYYRVWRDSDGQMIMAISPWPLNGFKRHPIGIDNLGNIKPKVFVGAFEGVAQKIADDTYHEDPDYNAGDPSEAPEQLDPALYKLCSVAGYKPKAQQNMADFRTMADNRGSSYALCRMVDHCALQMLFYIEFASLNSQSALGRGIVSKTSGPPANNSEPTDSNHGLWSYNPTTPSYGITTDGLHAMVYRGIENLWGNLWKWLDNYIVHIDGYYDGTGKAPSDTASGYKHIAVLPLGHDGYTYNYFKDIVNHPDMDWGFWPSELGGASNNYFCDYHLSYNPSGMRAPLAGGGWPNGALAGVSCLSLYYAPSSRVRLVGSRLLGFGF